MKFKWIFLFVCLLGFSLSLQAEDFDENTDWSISFMKCNGFLQVDYKFLYTPGYDDYFDWVDFYFKKSDGSWEKFYSMIEENDNPGGWVYLPVDGRDFHYKVQNGHSVTCDQYSENNEDDKHYNQLRWYTIPENLYGGQIEIKLVGHWVRTGGQTNYDVGPVEKSTNAAKFAAPTNLQASDNFCDKIHLTWTAPDDNTCSSSSYFIQIFVDDDLKETVSSPAVSYDFLGGARGLVRDIKIRAKLDPEGISPNYSNFTTVVQGNKYGPLDPPVAFAASTTNCDQTVTLSWQWSSAEAPKYFAYERSLSNTFAVIDKTVVTIAPDQRSINDAVPLAKQPYFYRMYTINKCDNESDYCTLQVGWAAGQPSAPGSFAVVEGDQSFLLSWTDKSNDESGFLIRKSFGGSTEEISLDANTTEYEDENVSLCQSYQYEIFAVNACATDGISGGTKTVVLSPDLSDVFTDSGFKASKGYYPNRVELSWSITANAIDNIRIYRRPEGSVGAYTLLATLENTASLYSDVTADGAVIYQYQIYGVANCDGSEIQSDKAYSLGFRNPTGIVNGHIDYEGGVAVENVKVLVTRTGEPNGKALAFDGVNDYLRVPHEDGLINRDAFTLQLYVNVDDRSGYQTFMSKGASLKLRLINGHVNFLLTTNVGNQEGDWPTTIDVGTYYQLTLVYNGGAILFFLDGEFQDGAACNGILNVNTNDLILGAKYTHDGSFLKGKMDEVRIFDRALSVEEIQRDYVRMLNPNEKGLTAYWRMDEGVSSHIYDASKTGAVFNENHGEIVGATWTDVIPSDAQLGLMGITNVNGDYTVSNIAYTGVGENFQLTPFLGQHTFSPSNIVLFIGGADPIYNNQDFTDISSFTTSVLVRFEDQRLDALGDPLQTCYVKDCYVYIDGQMAIKNGAPIQTDDTGKAEFTVPIGEHLISVGMPGHTFDPAVWPGAGAPHDFQEDITSSIVFKDLSRIIMAGRVVGGTREGDKKIGFDKSINNIGQATIIFRKQGNACWRDTVTTDVASGEYEVHLPPMKYEVESITFLNNPVMNLGPYELIDLTPNRTLITVYDTTTVSGQQVVSSYDYHYRNDYIYRSDPQIDVSQPDGSPLAGEGSYTYVNLADDSEVDLPLVGNPFGYPVFLSNGHYDTKIAVFERYSNPDTNPPAVDTVPVTDGIITINNKLGKSADIGSTTDQEVINMSEADGDTLYTFVGGLPNTLTDNTHPEMSFTQSFEVTVKIGEMNPIAWQPGGEPFRGFIVGGKPKGSNFTTNGPEVVDMILRDPPGSNSSAFLAEGSSYTHHTKFSLGMSGSAALEATTKVGTKMAIGGGITGPAIETEITVNDKASFEVSTSISSDGYYSSQYTTTEKWSTNGSSELVGAPEDIFIGKSMNFTYGLTDNIGILPSSSCTQGGGSFTCSDQEIIVGGQGYRLGKKIGMFVVPEGFETQFLYSQDHIENYLIPDLIMLRNGLLERGDGVYTPHVDADDPLYGSNNDNPLWLAAVTSGDPTTTVEEDYDGASYTFAYTPPTSNDELIIDSVRCYNQQIRLWQEALAENELQKIEAELDRNISFDGGNSYENSQTSTKTGGWSMNFEVGVAGLLEKEVKAEIGGVGAGFKYTLKFDQTFKTVFGGDYSNSTTFGYTIADDDQGDFYSIDVRKPKTATGPVFKTAGGQSMCPWEGEVSSKYYEPGTLLSVATMRREVPRLSVNPAVASNVPSDEPALYTVMIGNESESDDVMWYKLRVIEATNPDGAAISIDGKSIERIFEVPAGTSLTKVMTLTKAAGVDHYEGIKIMIYSPCEWDHHMNGGVIQAADTITISAHFVPACTDINIVEPGDKWVHNYADNNLMNMVFDGYDRNYSQFGLFEVQYRPTTSSDWVILEKFHVDTTGLNDPDARQIPSDQNFTLYDWDLTQMIDGEYELRAVTQCLQATDYAPVRTGLIDRVNPHAFGSPQPADGILSPGDEIMIEFNETIHEALLSWSNFDIRGVVNGTKLTHGTSLFFDGTADQYLSVREGINLQSKSFTVELWIKRNNTGECCVLSQGVSSDQGIALGFDASDHFRFDLAGYSLTTDETWTETTWMHWVCAYNYETGMIQLYKDGSLMKSGNCPDPYLGSGTLVMGKRSYSDVLPFEGKVHDLRVWNTVRNQAAIVQNMSIRLSGHERGLFANWPLDEAFGTVASDVVHYRNADVHATWSIEPAGKAMAFDGADDYLEMTAGLLAFSDEMDFTLEFWFKGADGAEVGLLSNGKGLSGGGNPTGWCIATNADGTIQVLHENLVFNAAEAEYWDNQWHHFALVVSRIGNIHSYVDGDLQNSTSSAGWGGFGGAKLWLGCRGWYDGATKNTDRFFTGEMDEIRVWEVARKRDQITRYMNNRLGGDEFGLRAYYPFEVYTEVSGVPLLTPALNDCTEGSALTALAVGDADYTNVAPNIKLQRPVQQINFQWAVQDNRMVMVPTDPPGVIENVVLDVTVKGVRDMHGNVMQSPVTWTAFVDRNQVIWEEERLNLRKRLFDPLTFNATLVNKGGTQQEFSIENLPEWITVVPQSGTLQPLSTANVQFVVSESVPIGSYSFDAYLQTSFDFDEKMLLNIDVYVDEPEWEVDFSSYQFSMNLVGELNVEGIISHDPNDMVSAFVGDECRGVVHLKYIEALDRYEAFLDVYSNSITGEDIDLRVWNASEGKIHMEVTPDLVFMHDAIHGSTLNPIEIAALNTYEQIIPLPTGWSWVSFNLTTVNLANPDSILWAVHADGEDLFKGQNGHDAYSDAAGWTGEITFNGGIQHNQMYMFYSNQIDTIRYIGSKLDPTSVNINVNAGWTWVGYTPDMPMEINEALGFFAATQGDFIKAQNGFAEYLDQIGWIGSLEYLLPGAGYKIHAANPGGFTYPAVGFKQLPLEPRQAVSFGRTHLFERDMSLTAVIDSSHHQGIDLRNQVIRAWVKEELRGIGEFITVPGVEQPLCFISIHGDVEDETLWFTLADQDDKHPGDLLFEHLKFKSDALTGSVLKPFIFHLLPDGDESGFVAYPNPFSQEVSIEYHLVAGSELRINIYNAVGQKIRMLGGHQYPSGRGNLKWDGKDAYGISVPDGVYFIRMETGLEVFNQRVVKFNH